MREVKESKVFNFGSWVDNVANSRKGKTREEANLVWRGRVRAVFRNKLFFRHVQLLMPRAKLRKDMNEKVKCTDQLTV